MIKVLHINCSDTGSTGKIVLDISKYLYTNGDQSVLCTPKISNQEKVLKKYQTSFKYEQGIYRRFCWYYGLQYGFAPISTCKIKRALENEKPDIVHLHSINGNMVNIYTLLNYLKNKNIPTVITNHAEFFYTGSCSYDMECGRWKEDGCGACPFLFKASSSKLFDRTSTAWSKLKKCFDGFENLKIVSVSPWVDSRAKQSPIMAGKSFEVIKNGVDTDIFKIKNNDSFRKEYNIADNKKIIFHVTSSFTDNPNDIKGGNYLIELAKRMRNDNVVFVVAGKYNVSSNLPENIILLGLVSDQNMLANIYSEADLTVITSKVETFGMSVAESLCCGTPIVGFEAGGPETVTMKEYSQFVPYGDIDFLEEIITNKWLYYKEKVSNTVISENAQRKYDYIHMAKKYYNVYISLK